MDNSLSASDIGRKGKECGNTVQNNVFVGRGSIDTVTGG